MTTSAYYPIPGHPDMEEIRSTLLAENRRHLVDEGQTVVTVQRLEETAPNIAVMIPADKVEWLDAALSAGADGCETAQADVIEYSGRLLLNIVAAWHKFQGGGG